MLLDEDMNPDDTSGLSLEIEKRRMAQILDQFQQATTLEVLITHALDVGTFKTLRCEHLLWATNGVRLTRYKFAT